MKYLRKAPIVVVTAASTLWACGTSPHLRSSTASVNPLVEAGQRSQKLGFDLFRALSREQSNENFVFSPHSVISAFSLLYPGARTETLTSLARVFGFPLDFEIFATRQSSLRMHLAARPASLAADDTYEFTASNNVWAARDLSLRDDYVSLVDRTMGVQVHRLDFIGDSEGSRTTINDHIAQATKQRIQNLMPSGSVTQDTRVVLTNAVYFLADWLDTFDGLLTRQAPFTVADGSTSQVNMMHNLATYGYMQGDGYVAVSLPYVGDTREMLVMLPTSRTLANLESEFNAEIFNRTIDSLKKKRISLSMPKFTVEPREAMSLKDPLQKLGLTSVFCGEPVDLSGMSNDGDYCVSAAVHKAFVKVDEKGTEAAAATGISVGVTSVPFIDHVVEVNRSSLFAIYDKESREVLFVGRIWKPE